MGFFGEVVTKEKVEVIVPDEYTLKLLLACNPGAASSTLFVQPVNETDGFALCCLNATTGNNCVLQHEFGPEDSPVVFWTNGEAVHITGNWIWALGDEDDDDDDCSDGCCDDPNHGHEERAEENDTQVESLGSGQTESTPADAIVKKRSRGSSFDSTSTPAAATTESMSEKKTGRKKRGKNPAEEVAPTEDIVTIARPPSDESVNGRKRWKIKPQLDEGVSVPEPKQRTLTSGVLITDFVVGKGDGPRLGSTVSITYDGLFPNGKVFDSNQRRSKPLKFRLGSGQVIRGLDLGMEGMRVGGSREIVVPPALGYGRDGMGDIPGNQTLVFRITLIGSKNKKK